MSPNWRELARGVFLVNALAIVYHEGKVLIGRRVSDPFIPNLTWSFPGGRPVYNRPLEESLKRQVRIKTGIEIEVTGLYHARLFPSRPSFLLLYYLAKPNGGKLKAGEKFIQVKWVSPKSVGRYFTTPVDSKINGLLRDLDEEPRGA